MPLAAEELVVNSTTKNLIPAGAFNIRASFEDRPGTGLQGSTLAHTILVINLGPCKDRIGKSTPSVFA